MEYIKDASSMIPVTSHMTDTNSEPPEPTLVQLSAQNCITTMNKNLTEEYLEPRLCHDPYDLMVALVDTIAEYSPYDEPFIYTPLKAKTTKNVEEIVTPKITPFFIQHSDDNTELKIEYILSTHRYYAENDDTTHIDTYKISYCALTEYTNGEQTAYDYVVFPTNAETNADLVSTFEEIYTIIFNWIAKN